MQRLGRYQLEEQLGQGGMAVVWRARDTHVGRLVAVKVPAAGLLHDPAARARFQREIALAGQLQHPRIVPIYDVNIDSDPPFLVMPLLPGGSLAARLKTGPLTLGAALRILHQVAQGLDAAHQHGIVHRDLKPSNILFDPLGDACLADFGISRALDVNQQITRTGVMGTPAYMSPEQLRDGPLDGRADQYGLGIVAYEMLTGRLPFEGSTAQIIQQHLTSPLPGPGEALAAGLREVLARATAKTAEARYPTAGAFAVALEQASREPAGPETALPPLPPLPASLEPVPVAPPPDRMTATVGGAHTPLPTPPAKPDAPSPDYVGRLYSDGRRAMDAADWETALQLLEQVVTLEPGYRDVARLLERARQHTRQPAISPARPTVIVSSLDPGATASRSAQPPATKPAKPLDGLPPTRPASWRPAGLNRRAAIAGVALFGLASILACVGLFSILAGNDQLLAPTALATSSAPPSRRQCYRLPVARQPPFMRLKP
jgi:serine/threonine protein kinase